LATRHLERIATTPPTSPKTSFFWVRDWMCGHGRGLSLRLSAPKEKWIRIPPMQRRGAATLASPETADVIENSHAFDAVVTPACVH